MFAICSKLETVSTLKDKSIKMVFYTQLETTPEEAVKIFEMNQNEGWLVFAEDKDLAKVPDKPVKKKDSTSLSQQQRNKIFGYFENLKFYHEIDQDEDFEKFYEKEMGGNIEMYNAKINYLVDKYENDYTDYVGE